MILDTNRKQNDSFAPTESENRDIPDDIWSKCGRCGEILLNKDLIKNHKVCQCGFHHRLTAPERIQMTLDNGSFREKDAGLLPVNPFDLADYAGKLVDARNKSGLNEVVVYGEGTIDKWPVVVVVMDTNFMMASMGTVAGEKITRAIELAATTGKSLIIFTASGGARMQEGILSLMQMAKTVEALGRLSNAGQLYITVITDPTTGGVSASFAALGDIILAEPDAMIGFTGPRVIEQTIRQKLPEGFQRAEFFKQHGFIDKIVPRPLMKETLAKILALHLQGVR
ncbi:MAG: acetyl-CoA carboxylase carboxyltransferase subunit beta [Peptococcaceae bacterium]|nr:acetyl-CoA carboxylase carboxyltransferase subunit beta [Candidatus Syntrophopropionicum ammoniitolerans]